MPAMILKLDGDNAWPDLRDRDFHHLGRDAKAIEVAVLAAGMVSGKPSVALRFELPNGEIVVAETSAVLFVSAARAIAAKFPSLFED